MPNAPGNDDSSSRGGSPVPPAMAAAVESALRYPLFDAILDRRARRFAVGASLPGGPTAWTSQHPPQPLSAVEQDLLAAAGTGLSGLQLGDWLYADADGQPAGGNALAAFAGRTAASPCGIQAAQLFMTDDEQTSMIAVRRHTPDRGGSSPLDCALDGVRRYRIPLFDRRLAIAREAPIMPAFNHWDVNVAGSTVFLPISDLTRGLLNSILLYLDEPHCYYIVDRAAHAEPLAAFTWLDRSRVVDLSELERGIWTDLVGVEPALMGENIYLALQAIGLGGWLFSAPRAAAVLSALGFRFTADGRPIGIDGLFEPLVIPYVDGPEQAVRALYDEKWAEGGTFAGADQPFSARVSLDHQVPRTSERALEAAAALYAYCLERYGHFPATIPAVAPGVWVQAHHLETEFYDNAYGQGAYPETVRLHQDRWHATG